MKQKYQFSELNTANVASPSSNVTLIAASSSMQILTPSTDIDVNLPSTDVIKGRIFEIHNESSNTLTLKSSDGDSLGAYKKGRLKVVALQDDPTDATHWKLTDTYKWQTNYLINSVSATTAAGVGDMAALTFNLEAGKTYKISMVAWISSNNGTYARMRGYDGATIISFLQFDCGADATDDGSVHTGCSVIHTMVGSILNFDFLKQSDGSLNGGGDKTGTWVQVEELPSHVETIGW